jgi:hypothetical protein
MGRGTWRIAAVLATAALALLISAGTASATFHLVKVKEVFPGTAAQPESDYVELQAYSPFQNQVQFGQLKVYNAAGNEVNSFMPTGPLANNANQMTVLIADSGFGAQFPGVTSDSTNSSLNLSPSAGAVCWPITELPIDCVSWGAFSGDGNLPSSAGTPFEGTGGSGAIANGDAITRSISANCPTALDDFDDTNNTDRDFSQATPGPRPNSAPITEVVCSTGAGVAPNPVKKAKKKCKKRKRKPGAGNKSPSTGGGPAYAAKKKCKKKRK